jgi:RsiW-degrading membrane proteinase PrsW (M82 family)
MLPDVTLKAFIACLPALTLVLVLHHLDSHRLLGSRFMLKVFVSGMVIAVLSAFINALAIDILQMNYVNYTRYAAPFIEEVLKASVLVFLFRTNRIGFLIDAGILGFTVGAGFSFVENIYYLHLASDAHYGIWFVRGFGTAIMHGGATAFFAIVAQTLTERHLKMNPLYYLPGLIAAVILHSIFNHFPVSPVLSTAVTILTLPTLLFLVFEKNTVSIHNFLEHDFEAHKRLLRQLEHGDLTGCEAGRFLLDLKKTVSGSHAREMIYYFHLHTELILSAEQLLLSREQGIEIQVDGKTVSKIKEMHSLENTIGKAAMHTLRPHLHFSSKELWEVHLLEDEALHHH